MLGVGFDETTGLVIVPVDTYLDVLRDEMALRSGLLLMIVCAKLTSDLDVALEGAEGTLVKEDSEDIGGRTVGPVDGGAAECALAAGTTFIATCGDGLRAGANASSARCSVSLWLPSSPFCTGDVTGEPNSNFEPESCNREN